MTINKKDFFRGIAFTGVSILFVIILFVTIIHISNYGVDLIDTSDKFHQQIISLNYPPLDPSETIVMRNGTAELPLCSVDISLQYYGPLTEGTPVDIAARGFAYPEGQKAIGGILDQDNNWIVKHVAIIGFQGASLYDETNTPITGLQQNLVGGQIFVPLDDESKIVRSRSDKNTPPARPILQTITWHVQGDYSPFISVLYGNGTTYNTTVYSDVKVHVGGTDVKKQEMYSKMNTWLTIALFFFSLIASLELLYKLRPKFISNWLGIDSVTEGGDKKTSNDPSPHSQSQQPSPKKPSNPDTKHKK